MDNTRKIAYIESDEDYLDKQAKWAMRVGIEVCFSAFLQHINLNLAFAGIDVTNFKPDKSIYYIE